MLLSVMARIVDDIKICVIQQRMRSCVLDYKTVAVGGPHDRRPVVMWTTFWRRRIRVGLGSCRWRRSGRLEVLV